MHRLKLSPTSTTQPNGSAAVAKQRLVATLAADRHANNPASRPASQLLAQLLADTPTSQKRNLP
ncbi:MAG: hypothetical protein H7Y32_00980 [Chloroflexales bacterium]|nr:hypothetical protein [Chloroflexales bacterium]